MGSNILLCFISLSMRLNENDGNWGSAKTARSEQEEKDRSSRHHTPPHKCGLLVTTLWKLPNI